MTRGQKCVTPASQPDCSANDVKTITLIFGTVVLSRLVPDPVADSQNRQPLD